ncbi:MULTISPECIES: transposase [unclassified Streptomyces]|uniref:transposase n=1 Tax=unclassified Streptomyces TaxID=2593676 RepID=UPI003B641F6C
MGKSVRSFSVEYKDEAVKLVVSGSGRLIPDVARELGIHDSTLRNWVNKHGPGVVLS